MSANNVEEILQHPTQRFFDYNDETKLSVCKINRCKIKGNHTGNLSRHIERRHKNEFLKLKPEIELFQTKTNKIRKQKKNCNDVRVNVRLSRNEIIKACVELVTINGRPWKLVKDTGFKRLMAPIFDSFGAVGENFVINTDNIKQFSNVEFEKIKKQIIQETRSKALSVQLDILTTSER